MKPTHLLATLVALGAPILGSSQATTTEATPKTIHCSVMTDKIVDVALATNAHDYADYKGRRYFFCCGSCPEQFKANPEAYVNNASIPIPAGAGTEKVVAGIETATILKAFLPGAEDLPPALRDHSPRDTDVIFNIKEWIKGLPHSQIRYFYNKASHDFLLRAEGHPDVKLKMVDWNFEYDDGSFQAYGARVVDADRSKVALNVVYRLVPVQAKDKAFWKEEKKVTVRFPRLLNS